MPLSRRSRALLPGTLALSLCLGLASCTSSATKPAFSSSGSAETTTPVASQGVAHGLTLSGRWPLTGRPASGLAPRHPVLVVKIDNSSNSTPQLGIGRADLVAEELVEGGETRLAVFFYEHVPGRAGPVRSMRASDIGVVKPAHAVLVASGGAPQTVRRLRNADIRTRVDGAAGFYRDNSRPSPYNLMTMLRKQAQANHTRKVPPNYLPWGSVKDLPTGAPARAFSATFSGAHTTSWRYRDGRYTNLGTHAAAGDRLRPTNVLVLRVRVGDAGYLDPAGNPVPETTLVGTGAAQLFHGGRVVKATWKKARLASPLSLRTAKGSLPIPPGRTWVELVPANGGSVSISR